MIDKLNEVKGKLKLINEFPIDYVAQQICQLFELKGDGEGLLTDGKHSKELNDVVGVSTYQTLMDALPSICKAQRDLTASIKDAEYNKLLDDYKRIKEHRAELMDEIKKKDAECREKIDQIVRDDADRCAEYLKAERASCQERVEGIKKFALQAIADEPEFPGDMPDEFWNELDGSRQQTTDIMRNTVRITKRCIADRLKTLWEKELG